MASWVGVGAGRRHVSAPTRGATPAAAVAALCPLAVVAADGGGQTFSSLKGNPRLSGRIREGSCVRYHFQLLRLVRWIPGRNAAYTWLNAAISCNRLRGGKSFRRPAMVIIW